MNQSMRVWVLFQDYFEDRTTVGVYATADLAKTKGVEDWRQRGAGWRKDLRLDEWKIITPSVGFPNVFWSSCFNGQDRVCALFIEEWPISNEE